MLKQRIVQADEGFGDAGVTKTGAAAHQLAVNARAGVALGEHHHQPPQRLHARAQCDVRATASHVGRDRDGALLPGLRHLSLKHCFIGFELAHFLNAHAGTAYGIPFPVFCRASFGTRGANVPALLRALVACGWFGIQSWIGGDAIYKILAVFYPAMAGGTPLPVLDLNHPETIAEFIMAHLQLRPR